jgi:hypothetical protein
MRNVAMLAAGAAALALSACATGGGESVAEVVAPTFYAELTGSAEAPGPGDPDGSGKVEVSIVDASDNVCYEIKEVRNIGAVTATHIHRGATGVAGPPVVTLENPADGHSKACAKADGALADEIKKNPGEFYVNVHSSEFPNGAIRGQLHS